MWGKWIADYEKEQTKSMKANAAKYPDCLKFDYYQQVTPL